MTKRYNYYTNATKIRLKNRRVTVVQAKYGDGYYLAFDKLLEKGEENMMPPCEFTVNRKLQSTTIKISHEAAVALFECLAIELRRQRPTA